MSPSVGSMMSDNYNKYINQMDVSTVTNMYTSTMSGAKTVMNNGLGVLKSNRIYQQVNTVIEKLYVLMFVFQQIC